MYWRDWTPIIPAKNPVCGLPLSQPHVTCLFAKSSFLVPASAKHSHSPRQALRTQHSGGPRFPPTTTASPVSPHAHFLVLAQPGRGLVGQDRTRGDRPRHLYLGFRFSSQAPPLYQRLLRQRPAHPVEVLRPHLPRPQ